MLCAVEVITHKDKCSNHYQSYFNIIPFVGADCGGNL